MQILDGAEMQIISGSGREYYISDKFMTIYSNITVYFWLTEDERVTSETCRKEKPC